MAVYLRIFLLFFSTILSWKFWNLVKGVSRLGGAWLKMSVRQKMQFKDLFCIALFICLFLHSHWSVHSFIILQSLVNPFLRFFLLSMQSYLWQVRILVHFFSKKHNLTNWFLASLPVDPITRCCNGMTYSSSDPDQSHWQALCVSLIHGFQLWIKLHSVLRQKVLLTVSLVFLKLADMHPIGD